MFWEEVLGLRLLAGPIGRNVVSRQAEDAKASFLVRGVAFGCILDSLGRFQKGWCPGQ
jgi:hypothetical protein